MGELSGDNGRYRAKAGLSKLRRPFAVISVLILILMSFQVMSFNSWATADEQSSVEVPIADDEGASADDNDSANATGDSDVEYTNSPIASEPITWDVGGGAVESYGGPPKPTISVSATPETIPTTAQIGDHVMVRCSSGIYSINVTRPASLMLDDLSNVQVVSRSYFTLEVGGVLLDTSEGVIVDLEPQRVVVRYSLVLPENTSESLAEMETTVDFGHGRSPKITSEVLTAPASAVDWRVVWVIEPAAEAFVFSESSTIPIPLSNYCPEACSDNGMSVRVMVGNSMESREFEANWSDAGEGSLSVKAGETGHVLQVAFSSGRSEIDPTIVATSTSAAPTGLAYQRNVVWYDGYYWVFYDRGDTICYKKSADGQAWSSEFTLPEGTALATGFGFDVCARDGKIGVGWIDSSRHFAYFKSGNFLGGKIVWNERSTVAMISSMCYSPTAVAIGTDGVFSMFVQGWGDPYALYVFRSTDGVSWESIVPIWGFYPLGYPGFPTWADILPFGDGDIALIETHQDHTGVRIRYWLNQYGGESGWTTPDTYYVGLPSGNKAHVFSAVAEPDGTIRIAMKDDSARLRYACITPSGALLAHTLTSTGINGYPSASLDANGDFHIFFLATANAINHIQKVGYLIDEWSPIDSFYIDSTSIAYLTSWVNPVGTHAVVWTRLSSPYMVMFGSIPLPYGTPGAPAEPWNRNGLSPYQAYFSSHKDLVSPGSGLLTLLQTDSAVAGRGVDLSISRIYQQPRYFRTYDGSPYMSYSFPGCDLGRGWSLDLPWMDDTYVYLGNGQRYVINWGNNGNPNEFENHDDAHFLLLDVLTEPIQRYELLTSSGMCYRFDRSSYILYSISDIRDYDPSSGEIPISDNVIWLVHNIDGRLLYLEDPLNRRITLGYDSNGMLETITRPDSEVATLGYDEYEGNYYLTSVTDPLNRVTTYTYTAYGSSPYYHLLTEVEFPTGAKNVYTYADDNSMGTEVKSWFVTQQKTVDSDTGALTRQTDYDYRIVSGRIRFADLTARNEAGTIQGHTEYIYASDLKYSSETKKDASGTQLSKIVTWYDGQGQPVRFDAYKGNSQEVSYSEYREYDDWGNVIYGRDPLGHESFTSYANTATQNSFQGGPILTRQSSGLIAYDSFDDWDWEGWSDYGNNLELDGNADPPNAPALKISRGDGYITEYSFGQQKGDLVVRANIMSDIPSSPSDEFIKLRLHRTALSAVAIIMTDGYFMYWDDGGLYLPFASYQSHVWYDFVILAHQNLEVFSVIIDGELVLEEAPMLSLQGGLLCKYSVQVGQYTSDFWVDDFYVCEASELVFGDSFSDGDCSDWDTSLDIGNTVSIDQTADPFGGPCMKISHDAYGAAVAAHTFPQYKEDIVLKTMFKTSTWAPSYILGQYDGSWPNKRLGFFSLSNTFYWWDETGTHPISGVTCEYNTWYSIEFHIDYETNTFDIYVDGEQISLDEQPSLFGTGGYIDVIYFQAGDLGTYPTALWVDNVYVRKSTNVLVSTSIFTEDFSDWEFASWSTIADGGSVELDESSLETDSPSMKLERTSSPGWLYAAHDFAEQNSDFDVQLSFKTNSARPDAAAYVYLYAFGDVERLAFRACDGKFQYRNDVEWIDIGVSYVAGEWYEIGFTVRTADFMIHIDGTLYEDKAILRNSGAISSLSVFVNGIEGDTAWVDNINIFRGLDTGYIVELYDSKGDLIDRSRSGCLALPGASSTVPPGYIEVSKAGVQKFRTPVMDVWGGDTYTLSQEHNDANLAKTTVGFGRYWEEVVDEGWPAGATIIEDGGENPTDCTWISDSDFAVKGAKFHESAYSNGAHYHGYLNGDTMEVYETNVLIQYIWLTEGKLPLEIMVQYCIEGVWKRAYWGGDGGVDVIGVAGYQPLPSDIVRVGDVPQVTGEWIQLTVKINEFEGSGWQTVSGVVFGLFGGTARWDVTSRMSHGIYVWGLSSTNSVELMLDDGTNVQSIGYNPAILVLYDEGVKTLPTSGYFRILEGGQTVYTSPWFQEIWNLDEYTYSSPPWYQNEVKTDPYREVDGFIHDRLVGSLTYQDYAKSVKQDSYVKYSLEGDSIETKARLNGGWTFSYSEYDDYGNLLRVSDSTGRGVAFEYSASDFWTYPQSIARVYDGGTESEDFETPSEWESVVSGGGGVSDWLTSEYSEERARSQSHSMKLAFAGAESNGLDYGGGVMYKEYGDEPIDSISLWMYVDAYYHGGSYWDTLDCGIRLHLYDSSDNIYATYTYWLACWDEYQNTKNPPDPNTILIYDDPVQDVWLNPVMSPGTDWSIDWENCAKTQIDLYFQVSGAFGDYLTVYFDDLSMSIMTESERITYTYDLDTGLMLSETDSLGRVESYLYDESGRTIKVTHDDGTYLSTSYDDDARKTVILDELSQKTILVHDEIGRLTETQRWGTGASIHSYEAYSPNWQDRVSSFRDLAGYVTTYDYDFFGRSLATVNPDLTYSLMSYDDIANSVTITDENGHATMMVFDYSGRQVATREYYSPTEYYETRMTYDSVGNLLSICDGNTHTTSMTYDSLDRLVTTAYPDGYSESFEYDDAGRMLTSTDRSGSVTAYAYDSFGKLASESSADDTVTRTYDSAGQVILKSNSLGSIEYGYNDRGRIDTITQVIGQESYSISLDYNPVGDLSSVTYPDSTAIEYYFDDLKRVQEVKKDGNTLLEYTHYDNDLLWTETTSGGQVTTYQYNSRGWPVSIVMKIGSPTKLSLSYDYDNVGSVESIGTESYEYDWLDRLTYAVGSWGTISYGYDAVGNRDWMNDGTHTDYSYDDFNKLTSSTGWSYDYDDNGNQLERSSSDLMFGYEFNSLNQMTGVEKWEYVIKGQNPRWVLEAEYGFYYDANGARARTSDGSTTTDCIYLGSDLYYQKSGSTETLLIYVDGSLEAKVVGSDSYFYIQDALGSTRQVWKEGVTTKAEFSVESYKPFGIPVMPKGDEDVLYVGETLDEDSGQSGLYYLYARYMDPEIGRFVSPDSYIGTISSPQTLNRFQYCVNNPLGCDSLSDLSARYMDPEIGRFASPDSHIGTISSSRTLSKDQHHVNNPLISLEAYGQSSIPSNPKAAPPLGGDEEQTYQSSVTSSIASNPWGSDPEPWISSYSPDDYRYWTTSVCWEFDYDWVVEIARLACMAWYGFVPESAYDIYWTWHSRVNDWQGLIIGYGGTVPREYEIGALGDYCTRWLPNQPIYV